MDIKNSYIKMKKLKTHSKKTLTLK